MSITLIILIAGLLVNNVKAETTTIRLAGQTRYDTCKEISKSGWTIPEKFPVKDVGGFWDKDYCINHPAGAAIDINPDENYFIQLGKDGTVKQQVGKYYDPGNDPYSITPEVVKVFQKYGWDWGGNFPNSKDYMHFSYLGG